MQQYISEYQSPLGQMILVADDVGLCGVWFEGQKYFGEGLHDDAIKKDTEIINKTKLWLDLYFDGKDPQFMPPLHLLGSAFQLKVWQKLQSLPYGSLTTYGAIAKEIAKEEGKKSMSAQAVGWAVGHNPIIVIVPCHRVVGSKGQLTRYAGGIDKKRRLLEMEGALDETTHRR